MHLYAVNTEKLIMLTAFSTIIARGVIRKITKTNADSAVKKEREREFLVKVTYCFPFKDLQIAKIPLMSVSNTAA